jgi:hypothetical protein
LSNNFPSFFLSFRLDGNESYVSGETVPVRFTIFNNSKIDVWVLSWLTPLEGLKGDILNVVCDGKQVPYEGIMMKRGDPSKIDYVRIKAKGTATKEIDLSQSYSFSPAHECKIEFRGHLLDVIETKGEIPRKREEQKSMDIQGNTLIFKILTHVP